MPFFFKQWGEWAPGEHVNYDVYRVGKKAAGSKLEGETHHKWPVAWVLVGQFL